MIGIVSTLLGVIPAQAGIQVRATPRTLNMWLEPRMDSGQSLSLGAKRPVGRNDTVAGDRS